MNTEHLLLCASLRSSQARQKRHLDFLVMDEGKFTADNNISIFSKGGLRELLGEGKGKADAEKGDGDGDVDGDAEVVNAKDVEAAMNAVEDQDDVQAAKTAQQEVTDENAEFDESKKLVENKEGDDEDKDKAESGEAKPAEKKLTEEEEEAKNLEKEFSAWQTKVGIDVESLKKSLKPAERYALAFKEEHDPFYSIHAVNEWQRQQEKGDMESEWNVEEIERKAQEEEERALAEGDLMATHIKTTELPRHRHLYVREKTRRKNEVKLRKLTGSAWIIKTDGRSQLPFYYNVDTGEAIWDKPRVLVELDEISRARQLGWEGMPRNVIVKLLSFLEPYERMVAGEVSKKWRNAR